MIWRLDWSWNICSGHANTTAQVFATGHIVMPFTQSFVALGIFMPFFGSNITAGILPAP